jgi:hypothetical protein
MRAGRFFVFVVVSVVGVVVASAGCTKKAEGGGAAEPASVLQPTVYNKATFPARGTKPITGRAVRGGTPPTAPNNMSKKLSERGTDREMRKPAKADMADCKIVPDNSAECDGDTMYYCDEQKLWMVDCNAEAKMGGVGSGSCFEAETFTECLGCDKTADGTDACCDFAMSVCCDKDGNCYSPK